MKNAAASERKSGFLVLLAVYFFACVLGVLIFQLLSGSAFYLRLFTADLAATLFVWMMGTMLDNASVYDPYWSVAPVVILILGVLQLRLFSAGAIMLTVVVLIWGVRLTVHWSTTFQGLKHQDWRYTQLQERYPKLWFAINLFGIHLFPTVVVFSVLVPAFEFIMGYTSLSPGILLGLLVSLFAVFLQYAADNQMRAFRRRPENAGRVNCGGLWKYSRHPNYLGEVLMWWGIFLTMLSARPSAWLLAAGPLFNTLMFLFISIPLMEKRQLQRRPEYADYMSQTGRLLPRLSGGFNKTTSL